MQDDSPTPTPTTEPEGAAVELVSNRWLEALTKTAEDKEHAAALVMLDDLRSALAYIEELEGNYGAEMARADSATFALETIKRLSWHCIPHYAYGDNQAACEMADRLQNICTEAEQILSANKPGNEPR